jgi:mitochondrial fission protein ELM1
MRTVWIVSEGTPGHVSQSIGLVAAMETRVPLKSFQVGGRLSARGWRRSMIRLAMGQSGRALPAWLLHKVAKVEIPDGTPSPDLIVSCGGKSVVAARSWACKLGVPYIFIGLQRTYPAKWFHIIISPIKREADENTIEAEVIPTAVTPEMIAALGPAEKGTWCMAIGGASASHPFNAQDWRTVAKSMNALAERENIRWLLTTSRRTGSTAEAILRKHLDVAVLKDAIWWSEKPRRELYKFMAQSELLFVTQDSVTMVTEAVSSGKPVVAVRPQVAKPSDDGLKEVYFERLEQAGRMVVCDSAELSSFSPKDVAYNSLTPGALDEPVEELLRRLHWVG